MITFEEVEAAERRSTRFMARLAGEQEGSTSLAAQMSALDVPDLLEALETAHAAGYTQAIADLRDDSRYASWWAQIPGQGPARRHLADYLENGKALPSGNVPAASSTPETVEATNHG